MYQLTNINPLELGQMQETSDLTLGKSLRGEAEVAIHISHYTIRNYFPLYFEDIKPEGRTNKMAHSEDNKFLRLFGVTNVGVHTPKCNCLYLCVEQHQYYALLA
jgi:hypothetical protein